MYCTAKNVIKNSLNYANLNPTISILYKITVKINNIRSNYFHFIFANNKIIVVSLKYGKRNAEKSSSIIIRIISNVFYI